MNIYHESTHVFVINHFSVNSEHVRNSCFIKSFQQNPLKSCYVYETRIISLLIQNRVLKITIILILPFIKQLNIAKKITYK